MVSVISQHIDTIKTHYYFNNLANEHLYNDYISFLNKILLLKKEAQETKNGFGSNVTKLYVNDNVFQVMPTSITGFSALIVSHDVSIALSKPKSFLSKNPLIKVEFRSEFLSRHGYKRCLQIVNDFISKNILKFYDIKISEIHLATDIQGYNFSHLDFYRFRTRARSSEIFADDDLQKFSVFGSLNNFTGFAFGSGNYHLRVYNKTKEIQKFKEKSFAKNHWLKSNDYDENKTVWRIEIQIRREKLKTLRTENIENFDNYNNILENIPSLWTKAITDFKFLDLEETVLFDLLRGKRALKNGSEKFLTKGSINKIYQRADYSHVWNSIHKFNEYSYDDVFTAFKLPTRGSITYVQNAWKSVFSTTAKYYNNLSSGSILTSIQEANKQNFIDKGVSIIDDVLNKQLDYFEKIDFVQNNGYIDVPCYQDLQKSLFDIVEHSSENFLMYPISEKTIKRLYERLV